MSTVPKMSDSLLKAVKDYWVILVFGGSLIVTWTQFDARIEANALAIDTLQAQVAKQDASLVVLQTNIAEIKATLEFIKNNISR